MSQTTKTKPHPPLDVLQSMVNGILIEIGKALGSNDKESGRTLASGSARLQTTIPSAAENFQQALDDLEVDILRAKAVIQRDLEEKRAERLAREAPVKAPEVQPIIKSESPIPVTQETEPATSILNVKEEPSAEQTNNESSGAAEVNQTILDTSTLAQTSDLEATTTQQPSDSTPNTQQTMPASTQPTSRPIGLGITTEQPQDNASPLEETAPGASSAVDSLFDIPNDENDNTFNFEDMDFSVDTANNQGQSQTQITDFDLSNFGNETQDFNMLDVPVTEASTTAINAASKEEDIFADLGPTADGNMDMDLDNLDMGEGNSFDELFLAGDGDDGNMGGGGEMEHGEHDLAFFGL